MNGFGFDKAIAAVNEDVVLFTAGVSTKYEFKQNNGIILVRAGLVAITAAAKHTTFNFNIDHQNPHTSAWTTVFSSIGSATKDATPVITDQLPVILTPPVPLILKGRAGEEVDGTGRVTPLLRAWCSHLVGDQGNWSCYIDVMTV